MRYTNVHWTLCSKPGTEESGAEGVEEGDLSYDVPGVICEGFAEVYGAKGFYVEHPGEVADAVQQALALDGPNVIEIPVAEYFPCPHRFRAPKFHRPTRRIDNDPVRQANHEWKEACTLGQGSRNSVAAYVEAVSGWQETVTTYRTNVVPRSCSPKSKAYSKSPRLNYSS